MYEVRQIIHDPYALDGPVIVRTENLEEAQAAIDQAATNFRDQLCSNGEGATDSVFVTVLIDWSTYRPFPPGFGGAPYAWVGRWWDVTTIDYSATA